MRINEIARQSARIAYWPALVRIRVDLEIVVELNSGLRPSAEADQRLPQPARILRPTRSFCLDDIRKPYGLALLDCGRRFEVSAFRIEAFSHTEFI